MSSAGIVRWQSATRQIVAIVAAGLLAGIGAVVFHLFADNFGESLILWAESRNPWTRWPVVLAIPSLGLLLVGVVLQRFPESRIGGVCEVLDALDGQEGAIPVRRVVNVLLSGLVLAFGGSVGPEGPMVQLGALAGSQVGQRLGMTRGRLQTMVRAGAAAGIAAAFRSPGGGVLLTLEMFGARFNQDLTAIATAAGIGYLTRIAVLGDAHPFHPSTAIAPLPALTLLVLVPLMGLVAAPAGHFFIWLFDVLKPLFGPIQPLGLRVAVGGLLVGAIGIGFPQVLSAGYPVIEQSLRGGLRLELFVALFALKMLATSITFGTGAVGGLFAPTLVIGAMYGGIFGYGFHRLLPAAVPQPELFILLGMVVMFGSIVKGYWSGLLMVADLSGCYDQLLLPGIIAGGISFFLSWELRDRSIFGLALEPAGRRREVVARAGG